MKILKTLKSGENNNTMWLVVLIDLVLFAVAFSYGLELKYCYVFLLIPICVNVLTNSFNLVNLLVCIGSLFGFMYGLDINLDDAVFFSIIIACALSFISFLRAKIKPKFSYKTNRTGRWKR